MAKKTEFVVDIRAKSLGLDIEKLSEEVRKDFEDSIKTLAHGAYAQVVAKAQKELHDTRLDYLKALHFDKIGPNTYLIHLEGPYPNKLEEGYPSFDMKTGMLASKKIVEVGTRTGKPWVQRNQQDEKFAHVPLEHRPFSKAPKGKNMNQIIRNIKVYNQQGLKQKITSMFKDASGKPLEGKVATVTNPGIVADLLGLTKFQKVIQTETGKTRVESLYLTWRTVSEKSAGWNHPGFPGIHAFKRVEEWVDEQLDKIIQSFVK